MLLLERVAASFFMSFPTNTSGRYRQNPVQESRKEQKTISERIINYPKIERKYRGNLSEIYQISMTPQEERNQKLAERMIKNCNSPESICSYVHFLRNSRNKGRHVIVLVGEELGY